jgi:high-affinity iron transporter
MLPTFVIGLREGLEAALIVGIIAGFLANRGRRDALRQVRLGVGAAVVICLVVGVVLQLVTAELPQAGQEGLETVIGLLAVAMVTYMILWMRRHARGMRAELESAAESALMRGSTGALVAMAFLAVLREGFETVVFLLAAFQASTSPMLAGSGALIGILLAVVLGYGVYRGGVKLNMARFFRITGAVLVVVAAGLLMTAAHTAHEAGWLNFGQQRAANLSWLVQPGTPISSLVTGMLGIQPYPTVVEVVVWVLYLVPMLAYVLWPTGRRTRGASARPPVPAVDHG